MLAPCAVSSGTEADAVSTLATALDGVAFDQVPPEHLASQTTLGPAYGIDENVVCVLVSLLLDHEAYLQAVLEYPTVLPRIRGMIFAMAKDDFLAARRVASASLRHCCSHERLHVIT